MVSGRTVIIAGLMAAAIVVAAAALSIFFVHSNGNMTTTLSNENKTTTPSNGTAEYVYPTSNLSSTISVGVGETFIIQLSSNAGSTGYDWSVATSSGILYLNYTVVSTSNLVGGSQVRNCFFHAVDAGGQTITLQDKRPFAPYDVAATINLRVTVS